MGGGAADQARVGDAGETNAGNVAGGGVDAFQIPDGLGSLGVVIGEETTTVLLGEDAREAPLIPLQGTDIKDVHHQDVAGLGAVDPDRAAENVNDLEIHILDVLGVVVVLDLAVGPVLAFDPEHVTRIHGGHGRDFRMPAVVPGHVLLIHRLGEIDGEECFGHRETEAQFPIHPKGWPAARKCRLLQEIGAQDSPPMNEIKNHYQAWRGGWPSRCRRRVRCRRNPLSGRDCPSTARPRHWDPACRSAPYGHQNGTGTASDS